MVVGEGKRGRGCVLATPARGFQLSGSASKNGTSRKSFEEVYSNVEIARQACTVFGGSTSAGVTKTPPRSSLPFLTWLLHNIARMKRKSLNARFTSFLNSFCNTGEHVPKRSACGARPSIVVNRRKNGRNLLALRSGYYFCGPLRFAAERTVSTLSGA